jgi:flagellar basal-body rod protein FlgB
MVPTPPTQSTRDTARSPLVTRATATPSGPRVPRVVDLRSGPDGRVPMRQVHGQHHFATDRRTPHSLASALPRTPEVERVQLHPSATRSMIGDITPAALHASLRGLAQRQRVTADNIANVNTPGFLAGRVDFESSLKGALRNGDTPAITGGTTLRSLEPTNTNGNNVNLDAETLIATETGLRYQLALNALDGKYNSLRTALRTA